MHLVSADLVPVGACYVILMVLLAAGLRLQRRAAGSGPGERLQPGSDPRGQRPGCLARRLRRGWPALAAQVAGTMLGGYLLLMAVLAGFYYGVDRIGNHFLTSALTGCAMLAAVALPVFACASWLARRRGQARSRKSAEGVAAPVAEA